MNSFELTLWMNSTGKKRALDMKKKSQQQQWFTFIKYFDLKDLLIQKTRPHILRCSQALLCAAAPLKDMKH